jgi:hypothetical protein
MPYWVERFRDIDWFKVKNLREMLLRLVHVGPLTVCCLLLI